MGNIFQTNQQKFDSLTPFEQVQYVNQHHKRIMYRHEIKDNKDDWYCEYMF